MRKSIYLGLLSAGLLMTGCQEEIVGPVNNVNEGDEVHFSVGTKTRTTYGDGSWADNATSAVVNWGNYVGISGDEQFVASAPKCAEGRNYSKYTVNHNNGSSAESVVRAADMEVGIQWGEKTNDKVDFYAAYPASKVTGHDDSKFNMNLEPGQSPSGWGVLGSNNEITPATFNEPVGTTYIGYPNMSAAIMTAHSQVEYGSDVNLAFGIVPNVLDITVNGLTTDRSSGSANFNQATEVEIISITVTSMDNKPLSGKFTIDAATNDINVTEGNNSLIIQPVDNNSQYIKLRRGTGTTPSDKLRVRAFILPGQVDNMKSLQVAVRVLIGDQIGTFTKKLDADVYLTNETFGKIYPIVLPQMVDDKFVKLNTDTWISQLDPNIYLTELSIPGSWYSYSNTTTQNAYIGNTISTRPKQYQATSIEEQLNFGIRAFQLHVGQDGSRSGNWLNPTYSPDGEPFISSDKTVSLEKAINDIGSYVSQRPGEFTVLVIGETGSNIYGKQFWLPEIAKVLSNNQYIYNKEITPETTIADVAASKENKRCIIVKINTNDSENENLGSNTCPALISRWKSSDKTLISPLLWNTTNGIADPVASVTTTPGSLYWCFSEADLVGKDKYTGTIATLDQRYSAITDMESKSLTAYQTSWHNTWFLCAIGGAYQTSGGLGSTNSLELAKTFNPYLYNILSNPTRKAAPFGIVLMNFADNKPGFGAECKSQDLVLRIINNNETFTLNRKESTENKNAPHNATYSKGGNALEWD